jgi:hypothetical protein
VCAKWVGVATWRKYGRRDLKKLGDSALAGVVQVLVCCSPLRGQALEGGRAGRCPAAQVVAADGCGGRGWRCADLPRRAGTGGQGQKIVGGALTSPRLAGRGVAFPQGGCGAAGRGQRRGEARRGQRRSAETGRWGGWSLCRAAGGKCEGAGQPFFGRATWGRWAEGVCGGRGDGRWPPHGGRVTVGRVDEKNLVG